MATATFTPRTRTRTVVAKTIPMPLEPTEAQIRQRAFEIYIARNGAPGTPEGDWAQAENELRSRLALLGKVR